MLLFAACTCRNDTWSVYARTFLRQAFHTALIVDPVALAESRNLTSAAMPAGCGRGSAHDNIQEAVSTSTVVSRSSGSFATMPHDRAVSGLLPPFS